MDTVLLAGGYKHLPAFGAKKSHNGLFRGRRQSVDYDVTVWTSWCGEKGQELVDLQVKAPLCPVCALCKELKLTEKAKEVLGL